MYCCEFLQAMLICVARLLPTGSALGLGEKMTSTTSLIRRVEACLATVFTITFEDLSGNGLSRWVGGGEWRRGYQNRT
jgi:hypothetical protein